MKSRFLTISTFLICSILGLNANNASHPLLEVARAAGDSLEVPEQYIYAYRKIAEDLDYSLKERLAFLRIAEKLSLEHANYFDILSIKAQEGRAYRENGSYVKSLRCFAEGMSYLGLVDDKEYRSQEAWFLNGYGSVLYRVSLFEDAKAIFKEGALFMHKNDDPYGESVTLNNVALCCSKLGQLDSALFYFKKAYHLREGIGKKIFIAHSLIYMAQTYHRLGNPARADSCYRKAKDMSFEAHNMQFFGQIYTEWAALNMDLGNFKEAAQYLNMAKGQNRPFHHSYWVDQKIRLFEETKAYDSLIYYLDSALMRVGRADNSDAQYRYLGKKEEALRLMGKKAEAQALLIKVNQIGEHLLNLKDSLQMDLLRTQREFVNNRERLNNLELRAQEQERIIESQRLTLIFGTLISLIFLVGFIVFYRLNANLRRANQLVKLLSKRTIAAAGAMNNAVMALDEHLNLAFHNPAAEFYAREFLTLKLKRDRHFIDQLKDAQLKEDWQRRLEQASKLGNLQNIISQNIDGINYYHVISIAKIETDEEAQGFVIVVTDISESQRKSQELNRKSKELEQANEAKDKMLSLLAHDLKEGVFASLELAKQSLEDDVDHQTQAQYLKLIVDSLAKTKALLEKTLDWVNQQSSGLRLKKQHLYIDRLAKDLHLELQDRIRQKGISFENEIEENLAVQADPNVVRIVLRNLISNAIKYVHSNQGQIILRSERLESGKVKIAVADNGVGMSGTQINQILNATNNTSKTGTAGETGTAIGLPLCQGLLLNMDSSLQIDSALDQGSEFYFILQGEA